LVEALKEVLDQLQHPPGGGNLDHLWIYVDQSDRDEDEPPDLGAEPLV